MSSEGADSAAGEQGGLVPKLRFPEFRDAPDWEEKHLGECLDYEQPAAYLVTDTNYKDSYNTPVLTAGKTFILGYTNEQHGIFSEDLPVIIFDDFTTATQFVDFPFKAKSSAMKILAAKHGSNIKFMYEMMQTISYEVGTHERHWISKFDPMPVIVPHIDEQEKIADCLSSVDALIAAEADRLDAMNDHKRGLMQQLFPALGETTPRLRFPEFQDAGEWEEKPLDAVCKIQRGKFSHRPRNDPRFFGGKYPFIQTGDVVKANGGPVEASQSLNDLGLSVSKLFKPPIVLITIAANIGDTGILEREACFTDSVVGLIPNREVCPYFLESLVRGKKQYLNQIAPAAAQKNINNEILAVLRMLIPSFVEQQRISGFLSSIDSLITARSDKINILKAHKRGLMQQLFPVVDEVQG